MKKAWLIFLCAICLLCLASCSPAASIPAQEEEFIVVGFSQVGAESDWRNANTQSMRSALSERNGYRLIIDDAQQKQERQITAIRNFIHQGVDYIVLAPTTVKGWDTVLSEARAAGIPVIIVDRMIECSDDDLFTCWIGSDFRKEGDAAVRWMEERFGSDPIRIIHLQGNIGSSAQLGRTEGLDAGLEANPHWELVFRESGDFTQAKGQELTETVLESGAAFDVIFSENDNMAYGAIESLRAAGIQPGKEISIISFDANKAALEMLMRGEISYVVECNPLHGPRVQAIIEQLERSEPPLKFTYVEETAFAAENLTQELIESRGY